MSSPNDLDATYHVSFEKYVFALKRPDFQVEGWMVDWVVQRAFAACEAIPEPTLRHQGIATVAGEYGAGMYAYEYDASLGLPNYTDKSLRTFIGIRQWIYFSLKRHNPVLSIPKEGAEVYGRLWKDAEKRDEVLAKFRLFNQPSPPTPPEQPAA